MNSEVNWVMNRGFSYAEVSVEPLTEPSAEKRAEYNLRHKLSHTSDYYNIGWDKQNQMLSDMSHHVLSFPCL